MMASLNAESTDNFNVKAVHDFFLASLVNTDDVNMDNYLTAYKEIYKFFDMLGTVFGFVGQDVKTKLKIMDEFRSGAESDNFVTIKQMISYEKGSGLLTKSGYVSGSRTLLRLHRGLDFIRNFLNRVTELEDSQKTTEVCQLVYNDTLSQYHPWLIRKGAVVAMYSLPTRGVLLQKVCGSDKNEIDKALELLPKMLAVTEDTYNRTHKLYEENDLHGLP